MDFGSRRSSAGGGGGRVGWGGIAPKATITSGARGARPSPLTLYRSPPDGAISLDDFELLAIDRLKVLGEFENAVGRGEPPEKLTKRLEEALKDTHLELNTAEDAEQDNISHWVLRLAFAATEDLRRRFLQFETALFRYRFEQRLDMQQVQRFMEENELGYAPISRDELKTHMEPLRDVFTATRFRSSGQGGNLQPFERAQFYKVSFTEVPELVAKRHVYVHEGFAYVPDSELISLLVSRFRTHLSYRLSVAYRALPYVRQEERIRPILAMLETAYVGPEFGGLQGVGSCGQEVRADNLDQFAPSMPMCMRELHGAFKRKHHIKYFARRQFQLFLKGVGLSMQECTKYFMSEMAKAGTTQDKFNKEYAYPIRHNYGQEGNRKNYSPMSCAQIISAAQPTNSDEHHGCPFKGYSNLALKNSLLRNLGGASRKDDVDQIMALVEQGHYQPACRKHFELQHDNGNSGAVGNHPNVWFDESIKYYDNMRRAAESGAATGSAPGSASNSSDSQALAPMEA